MAEIFTPATQPLSHSARVADAATQPLSHSEWLSGRVSGWVAPPATLAEWLSGFFSQSGRVAEWLTRCSSHSGWVAEWLLQPLWQRDWGGSGSLRPATEQRHLAQRTPSSRHGLANSSFVLCVSGRAWKLGPSLFLPRPGPEEQAEGQLTGEGDRQGQQKAAGSPVQGQGGNEAGSSIIVKQQTLTAYSYCLNPSLLSAGSAAACNHDRGDATSGFLDSYQFTSCMISLSKLISFVSKTTSWNNISTHTYIYIHTRTYILYTSEAPVMYRTKLHAQSRPKGHVIHQGAGVAEWRCTGYCSFTSSSGSNVHRPSERHR